MPTDTWRRSGLLFVRVLLALSGLALFLMLVARGGDDLMSAYLPAGESIAAGRSVYMPQMLEAPFSPILKGAFIYPPLSAALWLPFTYVEPMVAGRLFLVIELALLVYLLLSSRPVGQVHSRWDYLLPGMLLFLAPSTLDDLVNQNVGLPVAALSLAALVFGRRRPAAAAVLLLLGVAIKPTAALAILPLLGLWASVGRAALLRGLSVTLGGGLALVGISLLLWPSDTLAFPTVLANLSAGGLSATSEKVAGLDVGLTELIANLLGLSRGDARLPALLVGGLAALGAFWLGYRHAIFAALGAVAVTGMALGTTVWIHYLIAMGLLGAWIAWRRAKNPGLTLLVGSILFFNFLSSNGSWWSFVPIIMIGLTILVAALELRDRDSITDGSPAIR